MHKMPAFSTIIIEETDDLIFVNKPPYVSSLDERNSPASSILALAKKYWQDAQLCHRLDKETSGIMVIAKNPEAYREMAMKFEAREIDKAYHAIVSGNLQVKEKRIDLPLSITRNALAKVDMKEGKKAQTIFTTLESFKHYTLLECKPITGRLHQIRIHIASQNFPIAADEQYGGKPPFLSQLKAKFKTGKDENEQPIIKRFALHARSLSFVFREKEFAVTADYPKDFEVLLKQLYKFDL